MSRLAILLLATVAACTPAAPDPGVERARSYIREVTGDDLKVGGLVVTVKRAGADGRHIRISGTVENRFDEPVDGIRYTVTLLAPGDPPRVVDTVRHQVDTTLAPGEDRAMRVEIENPIHASAAGGFEIAATPVRLGGRDQPPPPGWE